MIVLNNEFINIRTYLENKDENVFTKSFYYSSIVGVLLILVVVFSSCQKKNTYYKDVLYIENNDIILTIKYDKLEHIVSNNEIIIYDKTYTYRIDSISINNNMEYKIKILLNYNNLYNNVFLDYRILLNEESIWNYIVRVLKGEDA